MKITRRQLRRIIKEEVRRATIKEQEQIVEDPRLSDHHELVQQGLTAACQAATPFGMGAGLCNQMYEENEDFRRAVNKVALEAGVLEGGSVKEAIEEAWEDILVWLGR
jgi:hypothetical protein